MRGFSLVELMLTVAVISILAALALPTYNDHLTRSKVIEGFNLAKQFQAGVADAYQQGGLTAVSDYASKYGGSIKSQWVSSITVSGSDGSITVVYSNAMPAAEQGTTITLTPNILNTTPHLLTADDGTGSQSIVWACASTTNVVATAAGFILGAAGNGTLPAKYAPQSCT